jgi:hypothetical protein
VARTAEAVWGCIGLGADNAPAGLTPQMCPSVVVTRSMCRLWQLTKRSKVDAPLIRHSVVPEITERHAEDSPTLAGRRRLTVPAVRGTTSRFTGASAWATPLQAAMLRPCDSTVRGAALAQARSDLSGDGHKLICCGCSLYASGTYLIEIYQSREPGTLCVDSQ